MTILGDIFPPRCQRCSAEIKITGPPIGQKCLDAQRAELAGFEAILSESAEEQAERQKLEAKAQKLAVEGSSVEETAEEQAERQKHDAHIPKVDEG